MAISWSFTRGKWWNKMFSIICGNQHQISINVCCSCIFTQVCPQRAVLNMLLIQAHAYFNSFSAAATKGSSLGSKTNPRRLLKTSHRSLLTKRVRIHLPVRPSYRRFPLRRNLIPLAFRIQRLKISLPLLKRMLKRSRIYKKIIKSQINKATGYVRRSQQANDSKKTKWRSWAGKISSKKFRNVLFDRSSLLHVLTLTWIRVITHSRLILCEKSYLLSVYYIQN